MIDVNKNHQLSKKKGGDDKLKLTNELKIISAPDDVYGLWAELIVCASTGDLVDPDTCMKFNERNNWKQESCAISRDFFKPLGNLSYHDFKRMALHMLNRSGDKRTLPYPKVTIKNITSVLESYYSSKDWVERVKRKKMVKKELHPIDPELNLINTRNEVIVENWRKIKRERCFSSATMELLIERPGEAYFSTSKQSKARNKTATMINPKAAKFFRVFLERKMLFTEQTALAHLRPYSIGRNELMNWPENVWTTQTVDKILLGVIDFRCIPGVLEKENSSIEKPFFFKVLRSMQKTKQPLLEEIKSWLFIVADEFDQSQVLAFVEKNEVLKTFRRDFCDYHPAKNERLYDLPANSVKALKKVLLIFLQAKDTTFQGKIPSEYFAPDTIKYKDAKRYNELPFKMYNIELRMEFYLWLVEMFCLPGSGIFSVFARSKLTCAALVSGKLQFRSLRPKLPYTVH